MHFDFIDLRLLAAVLETGSITAGAPIYALKGDMLRGQESVRKCELVIAKM